jgi:cation:H+ antiporter
VILTILTFLAGVILTIVGADLLVDGSSGIAKRFGMSEFLIGLTIVAIGTSMPEFVVSLIASLKGSADMSIGNVSGSNIFNTLVVLGATALVMPIKYTDRNIKRDIPLNLMIALILSLMAIDSYLGMEQNVLSRVDGALMLIGFVLFLWYSFRNNKELPSGSESANEQENQSKRGKSLYALFLMVAAGIAGLVIGGNLFVDSACEIARFFGVSEAVIALTLVAGGTSLPELASSVVAAFKGRGQMALGNVIGSNISNILFILGTASLIRPLPVSSENMNSLLLLPVTAIILTLTVFTLKRRKIDKIEGALFLAIYIAYIVYLLSK